MDRKISLATGKAYTFGWTLKDAIPTKDMRAFTVVLSELKELVDELLRHPEKLDAVRFYLGVKPEKTYKGYENKPALVMVGVTGFSATDPINPGKEVYSALTAAGTVPDGDTSGVYDFAYPCPDTCSLDSELLNPVFP